MCKIVHGKRVRVLTFCKTCKVFLCILKSDCFSVYHQKSVNGRNCRIEVDRLRKEQQDVGIFVHNCDIR